MRPQESESALAFFAFSLGIYPQLLDFWAIYQKLDHRVKHISTTGRLIKMINNLIDDRNALPIGYRLENYQIQSILGDGGFGITYLAKDIELNTLVAIKEYLPNGLAVRESNDHSVQAKSQKEADKFAWGLERFVKEAQTLFQFKHPQIVRVLHFFHAHNTAYIVMEYERGQNLAHFINEDDIVAEDKLMTFLPLLLDGLETIHKTGYLHRDIKPDNIYLRKKDYSPVLIDFGAARYDIGSHSRSITTIVTPGYAAFEQYQSDGNQQGAWTDIYSSGAVLYRLISGTVPIEATERVAAIMRKKPDPLKPAVEVGRERYSQLFLEAIDWALKVNEQERPQCIEAWREKLLAKPKPEPLPPSPPPQKPPSNWKLHLIIGMGTILFLVCFLAGGWLFYQEHKARLQAEAKAAVGSKQSDLEIAKAIAAQVRRDREAIEVMTAQARRDREAIEAMTAGELIVASAPGTTLTEPVNEAAQSEPQMVALNTAKHDEQAARLKKAAKERAAVAQAKLPSGPLRMMTGAGVGLRQQPRQNANKGAILTIGTIVSELKKTRRRGKDWYQIKTPNDDVGWVYSGYTMSLVPDKRAQAYIKAANKKLNSPKASFGDLVELYNLLGRASNEVELESAVELKLLRLLTLQRTLDKIPSNQQDEPRYSKWINGNWAALTYQESTGSLFVKPEKFQQLHDKYHFLAMAERILQKVPKQKP